MLIILSEKVVNKDGVSWIRTHGIGPEGSAFCSHTITPDDKDVLESTGQITCPDCILLIKTCKAISNQELMPEYNNELFFKRFDK